MTAAMKMQMQMGSGAMGIHYANGDLVGRPAEQPGQPEALLYAPDKQRQACTWPASSTS